MSTRLAPQASFSVESKLNTAGTAGICGSGAVPVQQGAHGSSSTRVVRLSHHPHGSRAIHRGLFPAAGVPAAPQDTQQPLSACSSWMLIPKSPDTTVPLSPAVAVSWRASGFGCKRSAGIDLHPSSEGIFPHIQPEPHLVQPGLALDYLQTNSPW